MRLRRICKKIVGHRHRLHCPLGTQGHFNSSIFFLDIIFLFKKCLENIDLSLNPKAKDSEKISFRRNGVGES